MHITAVHVSAAMTLAELEMTTAEQEQNLGPLVDIGVAGPRTALTFDMDTDPPQAKLILKVVVGGQTPVVPGFALACQGNCFVGGQLTGIAALRAGAAALTPAPGVAGGTLTALLPAPSGALANELEGELPTAIGFEALINAAAAAHGVAAAVLAGIGSHESGWGMHPLMSPNGPGGTGDRKPRNPKPPRRPGSMPPDGLGFGRGLMQIDWDSHAFARTGNWQDAAANIDYGAKVFAEALAHFSKKNLAGEALLRASLLAYNAGIGGATKLIGNKDVIQVTGPGTYPAKVLPRIAFYASKGFAA